VAHVKLLRIAKSSNLQARKIDAFQLCLSWPPAVHNIGVCMCACAPFASSTHFLLCLQERNERGQLRYLQSSGYQSILAAYHISLQPRSLHGLLLPPCFQFTEKFSVLCWVRDDFELRCLVDLDRFTDEEAFRLIGRTVWVVQDSTWCHCEQILSS
jgi:hypothetical protein